MSGKETDMPDWSLRSNLLSIKGVPLLESIAMHWERVEAFQAVPGDLLIATYPKAGTTWTQEIVDLIMNDGKKEECMRAPTHIRMPFLEISTPNKIMSGFQLLQVMAPPRVIKTHLPIQLVPHSFWENRCKVIYVARNAKDTAVSYYHFSRINQVQPDPGTWPEYLDKFMRGELPWGSWYDHVKGYWKEKEKKNMLYLFFEDMKEDPRREVLRIAGFLGRHVPVDTIDNIVQLTTFAAMKNNPMANYSTVPDSIFDRKASEFLRKGEVGDWQNHFSSQQSAVFDEHYRRVIADTPVPFRFLL
ncbi:sulfotransferase 1C4-like [Arapaima gigas]